MRQYLGTPEHTSPLLFLFVMMSKINDARDTQRREELLKVKVRVVVLFFRAMYELCPSLCRMLKTSHVRLVSNKVMELKGTVSDSFESAGVR